MKKANKLPCLFGFHKFNSQLNFNRDKIYELGGNAVDFVYRNTDATRECIICGLHEERTFQDSREAGAWVRGKTK